MPKEIRLPKPIEKGLAKIPAKLPFEERVNRVIDRLGEKVEESPPSRVLQRVHDKLPVLPEFTMGTPFGEIRTPEISAPEPVPPKLDTRRREALKAAIATDLSSVIGVIPVIGDGMADVIEDVYATRIKKTLKPNELDTYMKYDKLGPSTYAMIRTFAKIRK